jgi:phytoene dehydrogenase-like protein
MLQQTRVVVIGAGHSGLVAAAYMAGLGHDVTVVEQTDAVGGVCQTAEVIPGFRGNLGSNTPHNFDPVVLADLQLERHGLEWIDLPGASAMVLVEGGRRILSFDDRSSRDAEYDAFLPGEAARYQATLQELNALGRSLDVSFYEAPPHFRDLLSRLSPGRQEDFFGRVMFGTAASIAQERLRSPEVQASLAMLAATGNFIGPSTPGSAYQLIQRPLYRESTAARQLTKVQLTAEFARRTPRGGMGALTAAIARAATSRGARIVLGVGAKEISIGHAGAVSGVVGTDGIEYCADIVMSATNPIGTMLHLVPDSALDPDLRTTLEQIPMDGCLGKVYLALDGVPEFAAARSRDENDLMLRCGFRTGPDIAGMDQGFQMAQRGEWSGPSVIYGLTQTAFDDSLNRPGQHLMSLSVSYAPRWLAGGKDWDGEQRDLWALHVISQLSDHIPNLKEILVDFAVRTPSDLEAQFGMLGGNPLHGDVRADRMFNWRPFSGFSDYTTPIGGLYLCSTGTWPANYVSGLSGRNAALKAHDDVLLSQSRLTRAR